MGYARYIGRVGLLAVALGVGIAVATTPGVAWAGPTDTNTTASDGSTPTDTSPGTPTPGGTLPGTTPPSASPEPTGTVAPPTTNAGSTGVTGTSSSGSNTTADPRTGVVQSTGGAQTDSV